MNELISYLNEKDPKNNESRRLKELKVIIYTNKVYFDSIIQISKLSVLSLNNFMLGDILNFF